MPDQVPTGCPLTLPQIETVLWLSRGKTGEEIGEILGISRRAVERRLDRAKEVTGTLNRHGIVGFCLRKGWIT
jgi:DNA-binding CsgD family transcriptional regulator